MALLMALHEGLDRYSYKQKPMKQMVQLCSIKRQQQRHEIHKELGSREPIPKKKGNTNEEGRMRKVTRSTLQDARAPR
jgi:hypothetical protein